MKKKEREKGGREGIYTIRLEAQMSRLELISPERGQWDVTHSLTLGGRDRSLDTKVTNKGFVPLCVLSVAQMLQ